MLSAFYWIRKQLSKLILGFEISNLNVVLQPARMAELVDALDLGSSGRKPVGVQVPLLVPVLLSVFSSIL